MKIRVQALQANDYITKAGIYNKDIYAISTPQSTILQYYNQQINISHLNPCFYLQFHFIKLYTNHTIYLISASLDAINVTELDLNDKTHSKYIIKKVPLNYTYPIEDIVVQQVIQQKSIYLLIHQFNQRILICYKFDVNQQTQFNFKQNEQPFQYMSLPDLRNDKYIDMHKMISYNYNSSDVIHIFTGQQDVKLKLLEQNSKHNFSFQQILEENKLIQQKYKQLNYKNIISTYITTDNFRKEKIFVVLSINNNLFILQQQFELSLAQEGQNNIEYKKCQIPNSKNVIIVPEGEKIKNYKFCNCQKKQLLLLTDKYFYIIDTLKTFGTTKNQNFNLQDMNLQKFNNNQFTDFSVTSEVGNCQCYLW